MAWCSKKRLNIRVPKPDKLYDFWYICNMSSEQKKLLMQARVAVALQNELGTVTKDEEIEQVARANNYCKTTAEEPRHLYRGFFLSLPHIGLIHRGFSSEPPRKPKTRT